MVLEKLGTTIKNALKKIASAVFLDKTLIESITKDLRRSLLEADVSPDLVQKLTNKIKKSALEEKAQKKEQLIKLIHDELVAMLGKEKHEISLSEKPFKILFLGLYGAGKTTAIAKLGLYYTKRGFRTCLLGLDVHRPAASEQLEQLAKKAKLPCFIDKEEKNPLLIWEKFKSKLARYDVVLIDTAGRDVLSKDLIKEIKDLSAEINPSSTILVLPADIGQTAKKQASEFKKTLSINGVIITRMDSTAKGGGALVACSETSAKVLFIGTGEKLQDIEAFNPTSFVSRLLGMGDLEALLEKAKFALEKEQAEKIEKRMEEGKFSLLDFYDQIKAMQSMGPLSKVMELIPGLGGKEMPEGLLSVQEDKLRKWKVAIDSMTLPEIENPESISSSRLTRISKGSKVPVSTIKEMLSQHKLLKKFVGKGGPKLGEDLSKMDMQKLSKGFSQKQLRKLAKKFKGKMPF